MIAELLIVILLPIYFVKSVTKIAGQYHDPQLTLLFSARILSFWLSVGEPAWLNYFMHFYSTKPRLHFLFLAFFT